MFDLPEEYDASLPVDDFLGMVFVPNCWICGYVLMEGDHYLMVLRTQKNEFARLIGPLIHAHHILLVDLIVDECP